MSRVASKAASLALASLMMAPIAMPAQAQSGADYFKGKTVSYIVATAAGAYFYKEAA